MKTAYLPMASNDRFFVFLGDVPVKWLLVALVFVVCLLFLWRKKRNNKKEG